MLYLDRDTKDERAHVRVARAEVTAQNASRIPADATRTGAGSP